MLPKNCAQRAFGHMIDYHLESAEIKPDDNVLISAWLMAVLSDINNYCLFPAEQEIAHPRTSCHGDTQVSVVSHEDKHQEVANDHLDDV